MHHFKNSITRKKGAPNKTHFILRSALYGNQEKIIYTHAKLKNQAHFYKFYLNSITVVDNAWVAYQRVHRPPMTPNPPDASPPIQEENTAFEISLLMNSLQPFCRYFPFASTTPHVVVILLAHDVQDLRRTVIRQGLISPPFHLGPLFDKENWEDVTLVVMYT